jgi:hypothetical protein
MDQEMNAAVKRQSSMSIRSIAAPIPQTRPILTLEYEHGQLRLQATSLSVMHYRGLQLEVIRQSRRQARKNFRMAAHLKRDNSFVVFRRMVTILAKSPFRDNSMALTS